MKSVIINNSVILPTILAGIVESAFEDCHCCWRYFDNKSGFFEFSVYFCPDLAELEDILAEYI